MGSIADRERAYPARRSKIGTLLKESLLCASSYSSLPASVTSFPRCHWPGLFAPADTLRPSSRLRGKRREHKEPTSKPMARRAGDMKLVSPASGSTGRRLNPPAEDSSFYRTLFDSFEDDANGNISCLDLLSRIRNSGIAPDDPRIRETWTALQKADSSEGNLDIDRFTALCHRNSALIARPVSSRSPSDLQRRAAYRGRSCSSFRR